MYTTSSLVACVLALPLLQPVAAIDFGPVYAKKPALKNLQPPSSSTIDRQVAAASIVNRMNKAKASNGPVIATSSIKKSTYKTAKSKSKAKPRTTAKAKTKAKSPAKAKPKVKAKPKIKAKSGPKSKAKSAKKAKSKAAPSHGKEKRQTNGACVAQPISYGYTPSPNTPTGFLTDNSLASSALGALPPAGYSNNFIGQFASVNGASYLGYYQLAAYNISQCAHLCDSTSGCQAYNIYFERSVDMTNRDVS